MKRIICMFLLVSSGFITGQTKTVVTKFGEKIKIYPNVANGLKTNDISGTMMLGGALTEPTVLTTTDSNTLSLIGLGQGSTADRLLVTDAAGVLKVITTSQSVGFMNVIRKNTDYTIDANVDNVILVDATSGNINVTIPAGIIPGRLFLIKRVDSSTSTVTVRFTSETVDEGDSFITVGNKVSYQIIKEGAGKWQTLSRF
ncbi:hypothetical protein [Flavobacterium anhuiense]|uniref:hypothetical protein n=1 Tax=Flavobacterium anhuiense TaxID=459526 RepID=UPI003D9577CF